MSIRITNTDQTAQCVRAMGMATGAGTVSARLDADAGSDGEHFTLGVIWYCEEAGLTARDGVVCEFNDNTATAAHAIRYQSDGAGTFTVQWDCGSQSATVDLLSNPSGKWIWIYGCFERVAGGTRRTRLTVVMDGVAMDSGEADWSGTCVTPTHMSLGRHYAAGGTSQRNAKGIAIVLVRYDLVAEGTNTAAGNATVNALNISTLADLLRPVSSSVDKDPPTSAGTTIYLLANHGAYANPFFNGSDQRPGSTISQSPSLWDRTRSSNQTIPSYAPTGASVSGTPVNVDPFAFGGAGRGSPSRVVSSYDASPATSIGTEPVSGPIGKNLEQLVLGVKGGTMNRQVRLAINANSRAVYAGEQCLLQLTNGTITARRFVNNFTDMGLLGQAHLWNSGQIVGMGNLPIPCRQTSVAVGGTEASGTNAAEYIWGADCGSNDIQVLLYASDLDAASSSASNIWTGTQILNNTNKAWTWTGSRIAGGTYSGSTYQYKGSGNPRLIKPLYSYRIMIRDETGLPVSEGLTVGAYVFNAPLGSDIKYRKVRTAGTQNGADELAAAWTTISAYSAPISKTIDAYTAPTFGASDVISAKGSIRVDDTGSGLASIVVGDVFETTDASDVAQNEALVISTISGRGTATCVVTFEGAFKTAPTTGSHRAKFRSMADGYFRKVEVTFTADEVASGKWRGIEIRSGGTGNGVQMQGIYFRNTSRAGLIPVHTGWSGVGTWYQRMRMYKTEHATTGKSMFEEMVGHLAPSAMVFMTADQGTPGQYYVSEYIAWHNEWKAAAPSLETMFAATGPEYSASTSSIWSEQGNTSGYPYPKTNHAAALEYAGRSLGVPVVGWWYSPQKCGDVWSRQATPNDVCRDATHPTGVYDWSVWIEQMDRILTNNREAVSDRVRRI